jgi:hypothetical protein
MIISMSHAGYPSPLKGRDDVSLSFRIDRVSDSVITRDGEDYFSAFISIEDWDAVRYRLALV